MMLGGESNPANLDAWLSTYQGRAIRHHKLQILFFPSDSYLGQQVAGNPRVFAPRINQDAGHLDGLLAIGNVLNATRNAKCSHGCPLNELAHHILDAQAMPIRH